LTGKCGIEIGDDLFGGTQTIAALEDFSCSRIEFNQAFRVEQYVGVLAGFPAENIMRA
jgi:hypothetical protein